MTEKDLIKKIQKLKQIKPRQEWVFLCKNQILGQSESKDFSIISVFQNFSSALLNPVKYCFAAISPKAKLFNRVTPALIACLIIFVLITGFIFYFIEVIEEKGPIEIAQQLSIEELREMGKIVLPMEELRQSVTQTAIEIENIQDPEKVLKVTEITAPIVEKGEKFINEIKKLEEAKKNTLEGQVLAVQIKETENTLDHLERVVETRMAITAEILIRDLENRILTSDQQDILEQIKELFQDGKYTQALELYLIKQF